MFPASQASTTNKNDCGANPDLFSIWSGGLALEDGMDPDRINQIVILVGGRGTRLGDLTQATPKPLLDVAGTPFIDRLIWYYLLQGPRRITLSAGHFGHQFVEHFSNHPIYGSNVEVFIEPEPMGTGGALLHLSSLGALEPQFLMSNGDTLVEIQLDNLQHQLVNCSYSAAMALRHVEDKSRYGSVLLEREEFNQEPNTLVPGARIAGFAEKQIEQDNGKAKSDQAGLINAGVYAFARDPVINAVKATAENKGSSIISLEQEILPEFAASGIVSAVPTGEFFIDIGTPDDFTKGQTLIPSFQSSPALILDRDGVINVDTGYIFQPEKIEWVDGIVEVVSECIKRTIPIFVVTNQAGVARGFYEEKDIWNLHSWMNQELARLSADILGFQGYPIRHFFYCPDHEQGTREAYRRNCSRRKPSTGMIEDIWDYFSSDFAVLDVKKSIMVGDKDTDKQAAESFGLDFLKIQPKENLSHILKNWFSNLEPTPL
ncbi:MAG: HAD-IIIA family hydrolase [Pseudomonadota bacterium]